MGTIHKDFHIIINIEAGDRGVDVGDGTSGAKPERK
jgi:hypothetical protein